jgi:hypothetical protein
VFEWIKYYAHYGHQIDSYVFMRYSIFCLLFTLYLPALHIKAEVMRCVYSAGTQKPQKSSPASAKSNKAGHGGFLSTFSSFFSTGGSTPQRVATPLPTEPVATMDQLTVTETQVTLSVFSAEVDVKLNMKMASELHRSTKKNPPSKLKYELIYVGLQPVACQIRCIDWCKDC